MAFGFGFYEAFHLHVPDAVQRATLRRRPGTFANSEFAMMPGLRRTTPLRSVLDRARDTRASGSYFSGIAILRPAASGIGNAACAARMRARRAETAAGNGAVFCFAMSTCSAMISDVADSQPSSA